MRNTVLSTLIAAVLLAGGLNRAGAQLVLGDKRLADSPINSLREEYSCSITRDRLTVVVASNRGNLTDDTYNILMSTRASMSDSFGPMVDLGPTINSDVNEYTPRITADGLTVYFIADAERSGSLGGFDIWLTTRTSTSEAFGPAVNMGTPVNSEADDHPGHLTEDGLTFHFSSARETTRGSDIYVTTRTSPSAPFGPPVRLGDNINTDRSQGSPADEAIPTLSPDGRTLVFTSNRSGEVPNGWNLYMATRESASGPFGTPVMLALSTPGLADWDPFISPDGSTFYFMVDNMGPNSVMEVPILRGGHPFRDMTSDFYEKVLGRAPEAPPEAEENVLDAWQHGYYYYAVDWDVDVRLVMQEMGRLFFICPEYAGRERSNAEFIADCYDTFLGRLPNQEELDPWLDDVVSTGSEEVRWNRAEVMTQFAESPEFAALVAEMFAGKVGDRARNFVTVMYVGCFDRFVDGEGLLYWAGVIDDAEDKRQAAKDMARACFLSPEGKAKAPDNATLVVRLYRAFLNRFPADNEAAYWTAQLDATSETLDSLIERFGDSPEFTKKLFDYLSRGIYQFGTPTSLGLGTARQPSLSSDGLTVFFSQTSNRPPGGEGGADIWTATRASISAPFEPVVNLGSNVNTASDEVSPSISSDGLTLFFGSDREGGQGGDDIWMTTRSAVSEPFGPAVNLGPVVNSSYPESAPDISADGLTLYFSSDRLGGLGGGDIYVTKRASTSAPFGPPQNLGASVNSARIHTDPGISADGLALFMAYWDGNMPVAGSGVNLLVSQRDNESAAWGPPLNLLVPGWDKNYDLQPDISFDGSMLLFHRKDGSMPWDWPGGGEAFQAQRLFPVSDR